jgi:prepilin-type N-terminal cleavage/methylation domain-containing protein
MKGSPRNTASSRQNASGFTLIEVLAALSVLGIALFILMNTHYNALNLQATVDEEVALRQLIENVVTRAEFLILTGKLTDKGDFGDRYPDYEWSFEATRASEDDLIPLYEVAATVAGYDEEYTVNFFVYDTGEEKQGRSTR